MIKYMFPLAMASLCIGAATVSATERDYAKSVYWVLAAALNFMVSII